jgi:hypothetical protein
MSSFIDEPQPETEGEPAAAVPDPANILVATVPEDPKMPKLEIVYDGEQPWVYGNGVPERGKPIAISARDAWGLVQTYPTLFKLVDEQHALSTMRELKKRDREAAEAQAKAMADGEVEASRAAEEKQKEAARRLERAAALRRALEQEG